MSERNSFSKTMPSVSKTMTGYSSTCQWAFPENAGFPLFTRVSREVFDSVQKMQRANPQWLEDLIGEAAGKN